MNPSCVESIFNIYFEDIVKYNKMTIDPSHSGVLKFSVKSQKTKLAFFAVR